jgi:hypothetical protein
MIKFFKRFNTSYTGDVVHFNTETGSYAVIFENGIHKDYKEKELEYIMRKPIYVMEHDGRKGKSNGVENVVSKPSSRRFPDGTVIEKVTRI